MYAHKLRVYDYKLCMNVCEVITLCMYASKHIRVCMYVCMIVGIEITLWWQMFWARMNTINMWTYDWGNYNSYQHTRTLYLGDNKEWEPKKTWRGLWSQLYRGSGISKHEIPYTIYGFMNSTPQKERLVTTFIWKDWIWLLQCVLWNST